MNKNIFMPLKRKLVGIFFITLTLLLSYKIILPLMALNILGTYYEITRYGEYVEIKNYDSPILWETFFIILFFIFYIIQESFISLKKQKKTFLYLSPLLTLNLIFMNVIIAMYPVINRCFNCRFGPSAVYPGSVETHSLVFISFFFFLILLLWNYRLLKKVDINKKYFKIIFYINIIIQLITTIILTIRIPIIQGTEPWRG